MRGSKATILLIGDEPAADSWAASLKRPGTQTLRASGGAQALKMLAERRPEVAITPFEIDPEADALAVISEARQKSPGTSVIVIAEEPSYEGCKRTIRAGAFDYIPGPAEPEELLAAVRRACGYDQATRPVEHERTRGGFHFDGVVGDNPQMGRIFDVLKRVAPTAISVLIEGASGTGKELLARAIHKNSPRSGRPFRPLNCAGLTETLLESELFGHVKGAFTGAAGDRKGLFEIADKGTLFLDEIGDMPLNMQAKLLRVLEDGVIIPVGSHKPIVVDVRLISATNHDLTSLIERKKFRQDLYFRIKGVSIMLPSLVQRREDIPVLAEYFIAEAAAEVGSRVTGMTDAVRDILSNYDWPGNIRQLRNCVRTMVVMCEGEKLGVSDIPPEIYQVRQLGAGVPQPGALGGHSLNEIEKQAIVETLARTGENREKAAKLLGIGERTLYRKIKEYDI